MKEIFKLMDESEWIHGDDTPHIELYSDESGGFYAHNEFIFDFKSLDELKQQLKDYVNQRQ